METPEEQHPPRLLSEGARFLSRIEPFDSVDHDHLERIAAGMVRREVQAGETVLVEDGQAGTELYVVRDGSFDFVHREMAVDVLSRGEVFGHPTLLTGEAPAFTVRAREDSTLYCIPRHLALEVLGRPEGVRFVARTLRARLIQAARTARALPEVRTRTVDSLLHGAPEFCDPDTPAAEAAAVMAAKGLSALLVRTVDGLGIVTDVDLRDKIVVPRASGDAPVSAIMTTPVRTVGAGAFAQEASITMLEAGVNHLPVVDAGGGVLGVLSASSLMTLDRLSPFALRHSLLAADTLEEMTESARAVPKMFVDLTDANVDPAALMRILTLLHDAMVIRMLQLAERRLGAPPVPYAWLAFGSTARSELVLLSDQDNGLAYADTDDPEAEAYFRELTEEVIAGVELCGFPADPHGVVASRQTWRMPASGWRRAFESYLHGWNDERLLVSAAISFDFRHVAGELSIVPLLGEVIRRAPRYARFLAGLAELATDIPTPLGFRQRLSGPVDIKVSGLRPIQSLARYYAFAAGFTPSTTLERLLTVQEAGVWGSTSAPALREAFTSMAGLRLQQHAQALRKGEKPMDAIDTTTLRPLAKAELQEALRVVLAAQRRLPQRAAM